MEARLTSWLKGWAPKPQTQIPKHPTPGSVLVVLAAVMWEEPHILHSCCLELLFALKNTCSFFAIDQSSMSIRYFVEARFAPWLKGWAPVTLLGLAGCVLGEVSRLRG